MSESGGSPLVPIEPGDPAHGVWLIPRRPGLITPSVVRVTWDALPEVRFADALDAGWAPEPAAMLDDVLRVAEALMPDHLLGRSLLATWSLRREGDVLAAAVAPGLTDGTSSWDPPFDDPPDPGPRRDLYVLGTTLFRVVCGRWPRSRRDAVQTAAVVGGSWPRGAELAVRLCCSPEQSRVAVDAGHLLDVVRAVKGTSEGGRGSRLGTVVGLESMTGWRKSHGRPEGDNEDAVLWDRVAGVTVGIIADGVTGRSTGSGRVAAISVSSSATALWSQGVTDPSEVLKTCDAGLRGLVGTFEDRPAATAIAVTVDEVGRLRLSSVGDSLAFLCRPTSRGVAVTRLNREDSRLAEQLTAGQTPLAADSGVVRMACGVGPALRPHHIAMDLLPGDRLVLATDGAAKADPEDDGQMCWTFMDQLADIVANDPYPALIASLLCRRADELGGYDNATVLVIAMTSAEDPKARHLIVSSRVRRMETGSA